MSRKKKVKCNKPMDHLEVLGMAIEELMEEDANQAAARVVKQAAKAAVRGATEGHSPLPWRGSLLIAEKRGKGPIKDIWANEIEDANGKVVAKGMTLANMRLIVKAVNLHEGLVSLAKAITQRYGDNIEKDEEIEGAEVVDFLVQYLYPEAKAILAKTEER